MNFASKELSEKLQGLGCKSVSEFYYSGDYIDACSGCGGCNTPGKEKLPAYCIEDFLGSHPEALENCKKVWGEDPRGWYRLGMVDAPDQWDYLERTMVKS